MYRKMMSMSVAVLLAFCLAPAGAMAQTWELTDAYDEVYFGEIVVGSSSPAQRFTVTSLTSDTIYVTTISIGGTDAGEFAYTVIGTFPIAVPGYGSLDIEVVYTPTDLGESSAYLRVEVWDEGDAISFLKGDGVDEEPPVPVTIAEILAFFDASVADGTLVGSGPGNSADGRRNALRNKIVAAGDLIEAGEVYKACNQLLSAYERCDGLARPPEFVDGPAASELAAMIAQLMADMGC